MDFAKSYLLISRSVHVFFFFFLPSASLQEIDVKRFAKVEKIQGGELTDCQAVCCVTLVF